MPKTILIIEDDPDIAEGLNYNFKRDGYRTTVAESGEKGLRVALDPKTTPSLVILDLMLPGMSGVEICRRLRREELTRETPIIMLTARAAEIDKVTGLDAGADDYVVKPFSVKEVLARVKAVLRRSDKGDAERFEAGALVIDLGNMRVMHDEAEVRLTRKEFALLEYLVRGGGRVAHRQQILDAVWGYDHFVESRTLDVHIRRLRQKLGPSGAMIETVVGVGYRFAVDR